ncbi:molybdopterin cofactor-binding domain-containing protein [Faunimonas sp. B44]|uniref:molybdopterin cofactor-binding domain-containing protein n=1 Tax=Faunimonas sp. B44 TaxID=3461493 RepID=UPI004043D8B8
MTANVLPKSLLDNPRLSTWIGFEEPGRVRLSTGKVELGQGILTTLSQIAAEELDVAVDCIAIRSGTTESGPAEDFTSGSNSTTVSGGAIRLAAAEIRSLFLVRAAEMLACDPAELSVEDGSFRRGASDTGHDYWSLAGAVDLDRDASGNAPAKRPADYRVVGRSVPRADLYERVAGTPFVHDLAPPDMLHARVLHRPWSGAVLAGLDEQAVRKAAAAPIEIVRDGDFAAFLSADRTAAVAAWQAARLKAVWTGGTPPPDEADTADWLVSRPSRDREVTFRSDPGAAATAPDLEARFARGYVTHGSIAPSCALAAFSGEILTVHSHTQGPFVLRTWLARTLGLEADRVRVFHTPGAGCYGHNSADDAAFEAAFLALRHPGRPVRVEWTREDEFAAAPVGPASVVRIAAALDGRSRPAAWAIELWSPIHGRRPGMNGRANVVAADALGLTEPEPEELEDVPDAIGGGATRNAEACYDLPRQTMTHHRLAGIPLRTSTIRGLGSHLNTFAIESMMDELAGRAGENPLGYRMALASDPRARRVMEEAAAMADWHRRPAGGDGTGFGLGCGRYKNRAAYMAAIAKVVVDEEVRVETVWAAVDAGLVVNPDGAASQVEGGIVQAASWTLKEQLRFRDGRSAAEAWDDYPILRFSEVPEIEIRFVGSADEPTLGIGEASVGPTAAAIGNAVAHALGARIREMPLTRERIMAALLGEEAS